MLSIGIFTVEPSINRGKFINVGKIRTWKEKEANNILGFLEKSLNFRIQEDGIIVIESHFQKG